MKKQIKNIMFRTMPKSTLHLLYYIKIGKKLNLENPKTFNEKMQWLKYYYNPYDERIIECADKYRFYDYLVKKDLGKYSNKMLEAWNSPNDIDLSLLPNKFVLKTNNASGTNIFCDDKDSFNLEKANKLLKTYLKQDYGYNSYELQYSKMEPKIIAEEMLEFSEENLEYNFYCFNGKVKFCKVVSFEDKISKQGNGICLNNDWNDIQFDNPNCKMAEHPKKPVQLIEMINISEKIATEFPFVRVDFFQCVDKVILGELTFSPASGYLGAFNELAQYKMGEWLELPLPLKSLN